MVLRTPRAVVAAYTSPRDGRAVERGPVALAVAASAVTGVDDMVFARRLAQLFRQSADVADVPAASGDYRLVYRPTAQCVDRPTAIRGAPWIHQPRSFLA
jgi:hypothetical protein